MKITFMDIGREFKSGTCIYQIVEVLNNEVILLNRTLRSKTFKVGMKWFENFGNFIKFL